MALTKQHAVIPLVRSFVSYPAHGWSRSKGSSEQVLPKVLSFHTSFVFNVFPQMIRIGSSYCFSPTVKVFSRNGRPLLYTLAHVMADLAFCSSTLQAGKLLHAAGSGNYGDGLTGRESLCIQAQSFLEHLLSRKECVIPL